MSYIAHDTTSQVWTAGYFLVSADCKRETRQIAQEGATTVGNRKIVKAGTIYPANNNTATGIVYEDIDVTNGDIAGSVVTEGIVYEDRLPEAVDTYSSATVPTGGNPKELGLYERSGTSPNYVYTLTTDTTAADGKTYYSYDGKKIASATKTALEALGFKFVATSSTVTRPY